MCFCLVCFSYLWPVCFLFFQGLKSYKFSPVWVFCTSASDCLERLVSGPCGAQGQRRISPPCFLAECRKRRLNQGSFCFCCMFSCLFFWSVVCLCTCIFLWFILSIFPYCLFVSNSQVIGCEDHLRNDLYCVGWGVKLYSIQSIQRLWNDPLCVERDVKLYSLTHCGWTVQ